MTIKKYYVKKGASTYEIAKFRHDDNGVSSVNVTTIELSRSQKDSLDIGDDISVGYLDSGDVFVGEYYGNIVKAETNYEHKIVMESYGGLLNRSELITDVYEDKSPEYIVEDVVNTYTTLTYAGTATSGVTIQRFVIKEETAGEVIQRIFKELDWQIRIDSSKNLYFEPKGDVVASVDLTVSSNCVMEEKWMRSPNQLINDVTVIGDNAVFNTNETTVAGVAQTDFTTTYKIVGNVRVTVDGTEQVGGEDGSVATYDYTVDKEQKKIIFEAGLTGGESVIIYYSYEVPIKVKARNDASITTYGRFPKKITNNSLKTMNQARSFAKKVINTYGSPTRTGKLFVNWELDISVGETVQVIDEYNGVDQEFVVVKGERSYPDGSRKITVGVEEIDLLNWNKNIDDRIKNLESKQDNSDIVQRYERFPESLNVVQRQGRIRIRTETIGASWIVGSSTNGLVGANTATQSGSQQVVGSSGRVETLQAVVNPSNTMRERFNFDTYIDTVNTTASVNTATELCSFTGTQILQSEIVAKRSATFISATLSASTSLNLSGQLSPDAGTSWESVTLGSLHTFTATGNELKYKLTSSTATSVTWAKIVYN